VADEAGVTLAGSRGEERPCKPSDRLKERRNLCRCIQVMQARKYARLYVAARRGTPLEVGLGGADDDPENGGTQRSKNDLLGRQECDQERR
jgi:hypothetical protein